MPQPEMPRMSVAAVFSIRDKLSNDAILSYLCCVTDLDINDTYSVSSSNYFMNIFICAGQTYPKTGQTVVVHYTGEYFIA